MSNDKNNLVYREQLDDNVIEMLSEDIGSNYSLRTENTKTIVAALNEILGKDIICNAVGSPLLVTDTFEVMGDKIKGLTNSFKNTLLRLGISVSSVDKFEKLIEKIELYVDENASDADVEEALLESLKQTLIEKGVELNGNESLTELIVKVGELKPVNYSGGLNIISATELPATGKENQICVISDNPVDNFLLTHNIHEINDSGFTVILTDNTTFENISVTNNRITTNYRISNVYKDNRYLLSYVWKNNEWKQLTSQNYVLFDAGQYPNPDFSGELNELNNFLKLETNAFKIPYSSNRINGTCFTKQIDFTYYRTLTVTAKMSGGADTQMKCGISNSLITDYVDFTLSTSLEGNAGYSSYATITFDITDWTGLGYLAFATGVAGSGALYINYIELI